MLIRRNDPYVKLLIPKTVQPIQKLDYKAPSTSKKLHAVADSVKKLREGIKEQYLASQGSLIGNILNGNIEEDTKRNTLIDSLVDKNPKLGPLLKTNDVMKMLDTKKLTDEQARKLSIMQNFQIRNLAIYALLSDAKKEELALLIARQEIALMKANADVNPPARGPPLAPQPVPQHPVPQPVPQHPPQPDVPEPAQHRQPDVELPTHFDPSEHPVAKEFVILDQKALGAGPEVQQQVAKTIENNTGVVAQQLGQATSSRQAEQQQQPEEEPAQKKARSRSKSKTGEKPAEEKPAEEKPRSRSKSKTGEKQLDKNTQTLENSLLAENYKKVGKELSDAIGFSAEGVIEDTAQQIKVEKPTIYFNILHFLSKIYETYMTKPALAKNWADIQTRFKTILAYKCVKTKNEKVSEGDYDEAKRWIKTNVSDKHSELVKTKIQDLEEYAERLNSNTGDPNSNNIKIARGLKSKKSGQGIQVYTNKNDMLRRLKVLIGERQAGNNNKTVRNEIAQLADKLKEMKVIKASIYNAIYAKYVS